MINERPALERQVFSIVPTTFSDAEEPCRNTGRAVWLNRLVNDGRGWNPNRRDVNSRRVIHDDLDGGRNDVPRGHDDHRKDGDSTKDGCNSHGGHDGCSSAVRSVLAQRRSVPACNDRDGVNYLRRC